MYSCDRYFVIFFLVFKINHLYVIGIVVRNTLVTYDREHLKIGFWKTNCSELWERLHVTGAPSPSPSSSSGKDNSTVESPPTPAPDGSPRYGLPGTSNHDYPETLCGSHLFQLIGGPELCSAIYFIEMHGYSIQH